MAVTPPGATAAWIRENISSLDTLDPSAALDDLEPLAQIVGDARVVAIGEGAHFVEEFGAVRERVLRFLAERCGFTVFALEFSFVGASALDGWLHGLDDRPLAVVSPAAAEWGADGLMAWLRQHNCTSDHPMRLVGIDVPEAGGALRPVLEPLAELMTEADPESLPLVEAAIEIGDSFLAGARSGASAPLAWAQLEPATQDALTAILARLELRLRAGRPLFEQRASAGTWETAERLVAGARTVDYMFRAMNDLYVGTARAADLSVREIYMAETVAWHMEHAEPGARIAIAAHNNHIQKTPNIFDTTVIGLQMGLHLTRMLGGDYVSIAVTHTATHVPEMHREAGSSVGFVVRDVDLPEPQTGSIEHALIQASLRDQVTLTDLRHAPTADDGSALLTEIRTQSATTGAPLGQAFDAVISTPTVTRDRTVRF